MTFESEIARLGVLYRAQKRKSAPKAGHVLRSGGGDARYLLTPAAKAKAVDARSAKAQRRWGHVQGLSRAGVPAEQAAIRVGLDPKQFRKYVRRHNDGEWRWPL